MKKFEELYKLSKETFAAEHQRFARLEAKGFSYLTALTFLIGFSIPLGMKVFAGLIPPVTLSAWVTLNVMMISVIGLLSNWFIAFSVVKVSRTPSLPLNQEVIRFFRENREIDIYYTLAKGYSSAWQELVAINDRKAQLVTFSHTAMRINVSLLTLVFLLAFARAWDQSSHHLASKKKDGIVNTVTNQIEDTHNSVKP